MFSPVYFFPQSSLSLHAHIDEFSVVSPGGDNSKAPSLWKHMQLCWSNKNTEKENQQQMQVGKLLTTKLKLLPKLLLWQCTCFLVFGRSLPFLTVFHCLFYFYLLKPVDLFLCFSHLAGLVFLLFCLRGKWSSKIFQEASSWISCCCLQPHCSTAQWEWRLTSLFNLFRFSFQRANIK